MKIEIERSGGLAGISKKIKLDTNDLPERMANDLDHCMFSTPIPSSTYKSVKRTSADSFSYKISVRKGRQLRTLEFNELEGNDKLRSIMDYILKHN